MQSEEIRENYREDEKMARKDDFGAEVKKALIDKRMTQVDLSREIGISPQHLQAIIYNRRPGACYRGKIIDILKLEEYRATA